MQALGVLCSQIWGREGSKAEGKAQTLPLPQAELKGPEGPSLAAEKHGVQRERKEGGEACRAPRVPHEKVLH